MTSARHQETLRRVITRRGTTLTLKDPTKTFDPSTLGTTGTPVSATGKCTPPTPFRADLIDGKNVVLGDLECRIDAADWLTLTPKPGLVATVAGETYHVQGATKLMDGDTAYGYQLHLRGTQ